MAVAHSLEEGCLLFFQDIAKATEEGRCNGGPITVDADAIRAALAAGDKLIAVAKRVNVARSTVYRVMRDEQVERRCG